MRQSRFQRVKKPLTSDMNVVPYIDVMLVLLVIFMVTAPMMTGSVSVDLPKAKVQDTPSKDASLIYVVEMDKQGQFVLQHQGERQELSLTDIEQQLIQAYQANPSVNVMIQADQAVVYGQVMQLMATLQQAGLKQVGLVTLPLQ